MYFNDMRILLIETKFLYLQEVTSSQLVQEHFRPTKHLWEDHAVYLYLEVVSLCIMVRLVLSAFISLPLIGCYYRYGVQYIQEMAAVCRLFISIQLCQTKQMKYYRYVSLCPRKIILHILLSVSLFRVS